MAKTTQKPQSIIKKTYYLRVFETKKHGKTAWSLSPKRLPLCWRNGDRLKSSPITSRKSWFTSAERVGFRGPNFRRICSAGIGFKGQFEHFLLQDVWSFWSEQGCIIRTDIRTIRSRRFQRKSCYRISSRSWKNG